MNSNLIIVHGLSATGKSTIAKHLSEKLGFVFLSKDLIKESLFDSLGVKDREWSKQLGFASYRILYNYLNELLSNNVSVVAETNFNTEYDTPKFRNLLDKHCPTAVQVLCHTNGAILYERFIQRAKSENRHPGHLDTESHLEHKDLLLTGKAKKLDLQIPLIEVDTTDWSKVNLTAIEVGVSSHLL